jgi:hypothetical protein
VAWVRYLSSRSDPATAGMAQASGLFDFAERYRLQTGEDVFPVSLECPPAIVVGSPAALLAS